MSGLTFLHVATAFLGLASGAVALFAAKGARLHRQSGKVFVSTMLVMSGTGAILAALHSQAASVVAGTLTFYLVVTAFRTVRRPAAGFEWSDAGATLVALVVGLVGIVWGFEALANAAGTKDGFPAPVYFLFGGVALLAIVGDLRLALVRELRGGARLARHLWRMCFALFIATSSFFLGQAQVFPEPIRRGPLLALPVLLVVIVTVYWLARVTFTARSRRA